MAYKRYFLMMGSIGDRAMQLAFAIVLGRLAMTLLFEGWLFYSSTSPGWAVIGLHLLRHLRPCLSRLPLADALLPSRSGLTAARAVLSCSNSCSRVVVTFAASIRLQFWDDVIQAGHFLFLCANKAKKGWVTSGHALEVVWRHIRTTKVKPSLTVSFTEESFILTDYYSVWTD